MKYLNLSLIPFFYVLAIPASGAESYPTDNPVLQFYQNDKYSDDYDWTSEMNWDQIFDIRDFGGVADGNSLGDGIGVTDNVNALQAAVMAAYEAGGGVVYIPAGTWYFGGSVYLRDNVIIRGATPEENDAQSDNYNPPTNLEFPKYFFDPEANDGLGIPNSTAFKVIDVLDNSSAGNLGLINLDINRAAIRLSGDGKGTANRVIFGIRSNNVAAPDPSIPQTTIVINDETVPFQKPWQRHSYVFSCNIVAFAEENVLIANNRVNDKHYAVDLNLEGSDPSSVDDFLQVGYVIQDVKRAFGSDSKALIELQAEHLPLFSYTNHYGIKARGVSATWGAAPWQAPSLFRPGVTVRDNWTYTTMRVGYHLSGYGLKVLHNIKKDKSEKVWWLHTVGTVSLSGAQTLENRGMDVAGSNILIEDNIVEVNRHRVNNGYFFSVDGEGILVQECCGGTTLDNVIIRNNTTNAYIGIYKVPYTRNIQVTGNTLTSNDTGPADILLSADPYPSKSSLFHVRVEDNVFTGSGNIDVIGSSGGGDIFIGNNQMNGGKIFYPDGLAVMENNTGYSVLTPKPVGAVRDYPILKIEDPAAQYFIVEGDDVTLTAKVPGSFLIPDPVSVSELPEIVSVALYVDDEQIAFFTAPTRTDETNIEYLYEQNWTAKAGLHQVSAKAIPIGYSGPETSTEWFTISDVLNLHVQEKQSSSSYQLWLEANFPSPLDNTVAGDNADPDMDGMVNLLEYAVGGNPVVDDRYLTPSLILSSDSQTFHFRVRNDPGSDIQINLVQSNDFQNWEVVPLNNVETVSNVEGFSTSSYSIPKDSNQAKLIQLRIVHQN